MKTEEKDKYEPVVAGFTAMLSGFITVIFLWFLFWVIRRYF